MSNTQATFRQAPTHSGDFIKSRARLLRKLTFAAIVLSALMAGLYVLSNGNVLAPFAPFIAIGVIIVVWNYPKVLLPFTMACVCLFESFALSFPDSLTDRVPIFWDFNTVVQVYAHKNFHAVPLTLFEVLIVVGLLSGLIRGIYDHNIRVQTGALFLPIVGYIVCVGFGILHGMASGWDYHIGLFEVRAQGYILLAYLLTFNYPGDARSVARKLLPIAAYCIGFKGILLTFRFFITLGGHTIADQGVGAHEESFFFNAFILLFLVLKLADAEPKLRRNMLWLMPFVMVANFANERRAATAAMIIAVPILFFLCSVSFPQRRKMIVSIIAAAAVVGAFYLPIYWNKDGVMAQPARAVKSEFSPDPRDASSDAYRTAEDANLMYTMRTNPLIGYGYGRQFIVATPMADVTQIDPLVLYLPHDQILWVWMRLGTLGFFFFWLFIANVLIRSAQLASDLSLDATVRASAVYCVIMIVMLLIFGLLDLQLSSVRDILFTMMWVGVVGAGLRDQSAREEDERYARMDAMQARLVGRRLPVYAPELHNRILGAGAPVETIR